MRPSNILHIDIYPSFEGFPAEGLAFLRRLKRNNRRDWFEKHKEEYEATVKLPMLSLIESLQPSFRRFAPEVDTNPKRSLFRIHRDIRFSKDKTPYKTNVAAHFVQRGEAKGLAVAGYYLHIEPGEVFIGAGIYMPDSRQTRQIRYAIDHLSVPFTRIVEAKEFTSALTLYNEGMLTRVPRGYPAEHPMAEYLRMKHFLATAEFSESVCQQKRFVQLAAERFERAAPFVNFLNDALRANI